MENNEIQRLFIYGTLSDSEIQLALFKRLISSELAILPNYKKDRIRLPDNPNGTIYPILKYNEDQNHQVNGHVLELTGKELAIADEYEGDSYLRKKVRLLSGEHVWCYVSHEK
ncbi:MAG: gamma-glutamylcyclotransferase family protein [Leeuwenhoekiella sp.]